MFVPSLQWSLLQSEPVKAEAPYKPPSEPREPGKFLSWVSIRVQCDEYSFEFQRDCGLWQQVGDTEVEQTDRHWRPTHHTFHHPGQLAATRRENLKPWSFTEEGQVWRLVWRSHHGRRQLCRHHWGAGGQGSWTQWGKMVSIHALLYVFWRHWCLLKV